MCPAESRMGGVIPMPFKPGASLRFVLWYQTSSVWTVDTVAPPEGCGWRSVVSNLFHCDRTRARLILGIDECTSFMLIVQAAQTRTSRGGRVRRSPNGCGSVTRSSFDVSLTCFRVVSRGHTVQDPKCGIIQSTRFELCLTILSSG